MTAALVALLACGTERWTTKVLSDPAAVHLNLATKITTIAALNALPKGCSKGENERSGIELQVYRVTGRVKLVKREKDGDFHIVLADGKGHTVVVESPSPACARRSHFRSVITAAREACALFKPGQVVTVEGPAFYDFFHGQTGMSRSCVELHPVMWVR